MAAFKAGFQALAGADWHAACASFRAGLVTHPESVEAWEGLATAAYWVPDEETILHARERAYHIYRERGDKTSAARMAAWLGVDWFELRGQDGVANGWMQRANRLIDGHYETPESAWVKMLHARLLMITGADGASVRRMAARAADLARRLTMPDVEALGLALEGHARLSIGDVPRAVRCLDEAAAVVLGREVRDITAVALTLCLLMGACERVRDFNRARQWCAAAKQFSEDRGFPVVLSICRPHYAAVLMWRGDWPEAEEHLQTGSRELMEFMPPYAVGAIAMLGGLRWRQGRWEEAEQIFAQVRHEGPAQLGIAELMASQGDLEAAIELMERHLRQVAPADMLERAPALEFLVRCISGLGEFGKAAEYFGELGAIADHVRTDTIRASAAFADGVLASARQDWEPAQRSLGDAVELFERAGAPFESARARIALAEVLASRQRLDAAAREAHIAGESLRRVGAAKEATRAGRLLEAINVRRAAEATRSQDGLTARELEILTILADGRSNQEIAAELVLSVRTVERHISNIYQKLGLQGRTARTAAAAHIHRLNR